MEGNCIGLNEVCTKPVFSSVLSSCFDILETALAGCKGRSRRPSWRSFKPVRQISGAAPCHFSINPQSIESRPLSCTAPAPVVSDRPAWVLPASPVTLHLHKRGQITKFEHTNENAKRGTCHSCCSTNCEKFDLPAFDCLSCRPPSPKRSGCMLLYMYLLNFLHQLPCPGDYLPLQPAFNVGSSPWLN